MSAVAVAIGVYVPGRGGADLCVEVIAVRFSIGGPPRVPVAVVLREVLVLYDVAVFVPVGKPQERAVIEGVIGDAAAVVV